MKTMYKFMMAASALLLVACAKENAPVSDAPEGLILTALVEEYPVTRTGVSDGKVFWNSGDAIAVSNGSAVAEFTTADPDGSASASFTTSDTFEKADTCSALYPYAEGTVFADGKVNAEVPAIQAPVAGSFANGVNVAVAHGAGNALSFKNVCGYFKFTVPAGMTDLTKVEIVANGGEKLAGKISVNVADALYTLTSEGKSSVSLEGTFEAGQSYYMAVLPQKLSKGFTVKMTRGDEVSEMAASKSITVTRSASFNFGELYDGNWKVNLSGSAVPSDTTLWLTRTLENDKLFACLEELEAGTLNLKALHEDFYVAVAGGTFTDGEAVAYTTSPSPCDITIPEAGKYRIVLDKAASTITFYSSATDTPNKKVLFKRTNGKDANDNCQEEVSQLWLYGEGFYKKGQASQPIGEPYVLIQSLANPRLFVYSGETLKSVTMKFLASDNWNNEYMFGSSNTANSKVSPEIGQTYGPLYGGQGDNRSAQFVIPEGTNYIELFVGAPSSDESTHALRNAFELEGSYVIFDNR